MADDFQVSVKNTNRRKQRLAPVFLELMQRHDLLDGVASIIFGNVVGHLFHFSGLNFFLGVTGLSLLKFFEVAFKLRVVRRMHIISD